MAEQLTRLFKDCWRQAKIPEEWRKGVIVKLPKKGVSECGNWRGITLLSVPGKIFCMILFRRLLGAIDERLREEQAGFRSNRSCSEQIFCLRNIIEQCIEYLHPLCVNFIDFRKAFDSIHRESLWAILRMYGTPQAFVDVFRNLNSCCCVKTNAGHTGFFKITTGVRQGCILLPVLFNIALDFVMRIAIKLGKTGIS
ncbi:hypothetical protein ANCCEY_06599 [Ancylostoma ceylanicum]|uniref:Reverse transcriptase domain-containing protein n=1 Tax=Ancylostoma ceylanicum TaxID=53326 RepID=A0A0D6M334_9BILA|nr:hypothetical protein ANCCEY_06599 [Ancylostoma ceylanicum]